MTTTMYPNWFAYAIPNFTRHLASLRDRPGVRALQIGAYTGDATTWLLDHVITHPTATLIDVDTWEGSDEAIHRTFDWGSVFGTYLDRIKGRRVIPYRMTSDQYFHIIIPGTKFHFIYIDGDHTAAQVARDADNADRHLAVDGVLAFDDYTWVGHEQGQNPRDAIDEFLELNGDRYRVLGINDQVWLQKTTDK